LKNLCSICSVDFGTLELFDDHRSLYRITAKQELVGRCRTPKEMKLLEFNGTWWDQAGYDKARKMSSVGLSRSSKSAR